jgi:hypothetical protein
MLQCAQFFNNNEKPCTKLSAKGASLLFTQQVICMSVQQDQVDLRRTFAIISHPNVSR